MKVITCGLAAFIVLGTDLTLENWNEKTKGKTVFINFWSQTCHLCKAMAPAWNRLMKMFETSTTVLIAEVDCDGEGADLCESFGIENEGYPILKYGDSTYLEDSTHLLDYEGNFGYHDLLYFVGQNITPICSPAHLDLCDADQKAKIDTMDKLGITKLEAKLDEFMDKELSTESHHEEEIEKFYADYYQKYEAFEIEKEKNIQVLKEKNDYKLMKIVLAHLENELYESKKF